MVTDSSFHHTMTRIAPCDRLATCPECNPPLTQRQLGWAPALPTTHTRIKADFKMNGWMLHSSSIRMINSKGPRTDLSGTPDISSANAELPIIEVDYIIKVLLLTYSDS